MMSMAEFGSYIYKKRKEKGLTQEAFASLLGITPQAVSKWENGIGYPDISLFPEIAKVFGSSIDALFGSGVDKGDDGSPETIDGLTKVATLGNRVCYSNKAVLDISDSTVRFADGSKADLLDGSVVNTGRGEVCFFESEPQNKKHVDHRPLRFENELEPFTGICADVNGSYDLEIMKSEDGVFKIIADGSQSFVDSLEMRISDGVFVLSNKVERENFRGRNLVRIYVGFDLGSELEITVNGCGTCNIAPDFKKTKVTVNGSGVVNAKNSGSVFGTVNGSGVLKFDACDDVSFDVNGSGDIDAKSCSDAKVRIHGSGDVKIGNVGGNSDIEIHGSGDVGLSGISNRFVCSIDGSGDIHGENLTVHEAEIRADGEGEIVLGRIIERSYEKLSKNAKLRVAQRG